MSTTVAVILACVGFGVVTAVTLCGVAATLKVLAVVEQVVKGVMATSQGVTEMLHAIGELEDRLKAPATRNYFIMDGSRKAILGTFMGHVNSDGDPVPSQPYKLTDNRGDPVTILIIKRGLGGVMGGVE